MRALYVRRTDAARNGMRRLLCSLLAQGAFGCTFLCGSTSGPTGRSEVCEPRGERLREAGARAADRETTRIRGQFCLSAG